MLSQMVNSLIDGAGPLKGYHALAQRLRAASNACSQLVAYIDRHSPEDLEEAIADHNKEIRQYILLLLDPKAGPDAMAILKEWQDGEITLDPSTL